MKILKNDNIAPGQKVPWVLQKEMHGFFINSMVSRALRLGTVIAITDVGL